MKDHLLNLYFAPPHWRRPTIVGSAPDELLMYFGDSGFVHVQVDDNGWAAEIDPNADGHGHWFKSTRPMFSTHVEVPLPANARPGAHAVREDAGARWLTVTWEPPASALHDLWLIMARAETDSTPMRDVSPAIQACRAAVGRLRDDEIERILDSIGVKVCVDKWVCRCLEDVTAGLTRTSQRA